VAQEGAAWISTPSGARRHSDYDAYERKTYELGPYQDKQNSNKEQTNKQTKKTNMPTEQPCGRCRPMS
jgi:hypothetical protein